MHHAEGTPGAACVACHMPTTTYMVVHPRHDHSLRIPRPDLSARSARPMRAPTATRRSRRSGRPMRSRSWTGKPPAGYQNFAEPSHAGSLGAPGARGALLTLIEDRAQPAIVRASAIDRLGAPGSRRRAGSVAERSTTRIRWCDLAAVEALRNAILRPGCAICRGCWPTRCAACGSRRRARSPGRPNRSSPTARRARVHEGARRVRRGADVQRRPARGKLNLGNLHARRGDGEPPSPSSRRRSRSTRTFVFAYANLADLYRARGAEGEAVAVCARGSRAIRVRPRCTMRSASRSSGRSRRAGKPEVARRGRHSRRRARYAYVYAVALNDARGRRRRRWGAQRRAKRGAVRSRCAVRARVLQRSPATARPRWVTSKELRGLDPDNPAYARMAQEFAGAPARK